MFTTAGVTAEAAAEVALVATLLTTDAAVVATCPTSEVAVVSAPLTADVAVVTNPPTTVSAAGVAAAAAAVVVPGSVGSVVAATTAELTSETTELTTLFTSESVSNTLDVVSLDVNAVVVSGAVVLEKPVTGTICLLMIRGMYFGFSSVVCGAGPGMASLRAWPSMASIAMDENFMLENENNWRRYKNKLSNEICSSMLVTSSLLRHRDQNSQ